MALPASPTSARHLDIASDVLTDRLNGLVDAGIMSREQYQEPGQPGTRELSPDRRGRELKIVIGALQQWGDAHLPVACGPTMERLDARSGEPIEVGFVNAKGRRVALDNADFVRTAAYPRRSD